jgi:hypothetical protein
VIEEIDRPPNLQGGNIMIRMAGPGGTAMDPAKMTPEQKAEADAMRLLLNKKEFTKLTLGMFASSLSAFPLEFTYAGQAESADGKADVINVKGPGDFAVILFVDAQTHMPLMVSWMDKEPVVITTSSGGPGGPGGASGGAGETRIMTFSGGGGAGGGMAVGGSTFTAAVPAGAAGGGQKMSKEELEKLQKDFEERRKEAEAKRRTVEFRVYYSEYKSVGGVKLPFRIQRSIDGKTTEEMVFDTIKLNPKIDAKKFEASK